MAKNKKKPARKTQQRAKTRQATKADQFFPPALLTLGSVGLKLIKAAEGIDFLMSIENDKMANFLDVMFTYVWAIAAILGAIWWFYVWKNGTTRTWQTSVFTTAVISAVLSFFAGSALTASYVSGGPEALLTYGVVVTTNGNCNARVNTSMLKNYSESHYLVLICGPVDAKAERYFDKRVIISDKRLIDYESMMVVAHMPDSMVPVFRRFNRTWYRAAVVPNKLEIDQFETLAELEAAGGLLIGDFKASEGGRFPISSAQPPTT